MISGDKLIAFKAGQLFDEAHKELDKADIHDFDSEILFVTDYIVGCFQKQQPLLRFLAKNLSWVSSGTLTQRNPLSQSNSL